VWLLRRRKRLWGRAGAGAARSTSKTLQTILVCAGVCVLACMRLKTIDGLRFGMPDVWFFADFVSHVAEMVRTSGRTIL
jgi:hypothetical protein